MGEKSKDIFQQLFWIVATIALFFGFMWGAGKLAEYVGPPSMTDEESYDYYINGIDPNIDQSQQYGGR